MDQAEEYWRPKYWAFAAIIPACFFIFEALSVSSFETMQAPNVSLVLQLTLMFAFFSVWIFVPRILWGLAGTARLDDQLNWRRYSLRAAATALALSVLHLFLLALILRYMHSPPGWGVKHLANSFAEVWIGQAGVWLLAFFATAGAIGLIRTQKPAATPTLKRISIRQNGRLISMPLGEVIWINAAGNYSEIHTLKGKFTERKTLASLEQALAGTSFLRAHRSALVNGEHVTAIKSDATNGNYCVQLTKNQEAPLSRRRLREFKSILQHIA